MFPWFLDQQKGDLVGATYDIVNIGKSSAETVGYLDTATMELHLTGEIEFSDGTSTPPMDFVKNCEPGKSASAFEFRFLSVLSADGGISCI